MTIHVVDHPLVHHKLSLIRDRKTSGSLFRALIEEVGLILAAESTRTLPTEPVVVETPLERTGTLRLKSLDPVLVPVLRAGLGLLPSFLKLLHDTYGVDAAVVDGHLVIGSPATPHPGGKG